MNKIISIKLPILALAMVFTISCTSDLEDSEKKLSSGSVGENLSSPNEQSSSSSSVQSSSSHILCKPTMVGIGTEDVSDCAIPPPRFRDERDGKYYFLVEIGTQTWMTQNLNYDVPNNDTDICYDNDPANCNGRLYDWATAQTACPAGWHLPSDEEWTQLTNFVGSDAATYGFTPISIIPNDNIAGGWWSSTEVFYNCGKSTNCINADPSAYIRRMSYDDIGVFKKEISAHNKLNAVRCIKD